MPLCCSLVCYKIASDHSSGVAVAKDLGNVQHISFSSRDKLITACVGKEVWVLNIQVSDKLGQIIRLASCYCNNKINILQIGFLWIRE